MRSVPYCSCNTRMESDISFPQRVISDHQFWKSTCYLENWNREIMHTIYKWSREELNCDFEATEKHSKGYVVVRVGAWLIFNC